MYLITVGSKKFDELVSKADELAGDSDSAWVAQIGTGSYIPENMKWFDYVDSLNHYYRQADIVISHGGAGTIFECLEKGLKLVACPNPNLKGDHQKELVNKFAEEGYLVACNDLDNLGEKIKKVEEKELREYSRPNNDIVNRIKNEIEGWSE